MHHPIDLLNQAPDCGMPFYDPVNTFFFLDHVASMDTARKTGKLYWRRHGLKSRMSFSQMSLPYEETTAWEFPDEYDHDKTLDFDIRFLSDGIMRLRLSANGSLPDPCQLSEMLVEHSDVDWDVEEDASGVCYRSPQGCLRISYDPIELEILSGDGKKLTRLVLIHNQAGLVNDRPVPTSFVRKADDLQRMMSVTLSMEPGERIVGCGESFTRVDKRGQKLHMWTCDPKGVMGPGMYKPVPFYISSRGYGLFLHTSAPSTFDFGTAYDGALNIFVDNSFVDLFFFWGTPQEILGSYTSLTGKSPVPPLWSFGLWMSRCTYRTQEEVLDIAVKMREYQVPCDVIHIDTGWFETNWRCDFQFSPTRFPDAGKMLKTLRDAGFQTSLWMNTYFTPNNPLYGFLIKNGFAVRGSDGGLPTEDAVLDLSNPEAVSWLSGVLEKLFRMGVGAVKTDFGEAGPLHGVYFSGMSGKLEHNLYPLRYQKAVYAAAKKVSGDSLIWARAGWAGAQRYPVHWGGDSESTENGMAASIRGGISLGASGFTYWSHDIGGFCGTCPEKMYLRWLAFGAFSSHTRCHGQTPKEPWTMSEAGLKMFRSIVQARYMLLPYIYTQAVLSSRAGIPMLRGLFLHDPDDPLCWMQDDEYLLGSDLLVAPLIAEEEQRHVYLPKGIWHNYQSGEMYAGGQMCLIKAGELPIILLVRDGAAIPHAPAAQSTREIDWDKVFFRLYRSAGEASGMIIQPDGTVRNFRQEK